MPRAKFLNTKPRGRVGAYAFFVQTCNDEQKKNFPNQNIVFRDFSRQCSERWKKMTEQDKSPFQDLAEKDKIRFQQEWDVYEKSISGRGSELSKLREKKLRGTKKTRRKKDPNAPKRALSAFFIFCSTERQTVKKQYPHYGMSDVSRELGLRWASADPEIKAKCEEMSRQQSERYSEEMKRYKSGNVAASSSIKSEDEDSDSETDDSSMEDDD